VLAEKTVDYLWMRDNLAVHGDGQTHYYHQGPVFEGDAWDPAETQNLKDKGAVKGTAVADLCTLVGGVSEGDEVVLVAIDGWHARFACDNIAAPPAAQGVIALCWYCGEGASEGEKFGTGYPGNDAFNSALQIVFMTEQPNRDGKHVFGNQDMRTSLPQTKYQYFYDGQYPSTNGLSGKWISEVRIYSGGAPADLVIAPHGNSEPTKAAGLSPWLATIMGVTGVALVGWYVWARRKTT